MKYIAAYLLAKSRVQENPSINDIRDIIESIGLEYDNRKGEDTIRRFNGKNINEIYTSQEIERMTNELLEEIEKQNPQAPINGSNILCQNKTFGLAMTLRLTENGPIERYALTLINNQNFLNSGGYKIDLQKEDIAHNANQRWHFGSGEYNTIINPECQEHVVWDIADGDSLNPPERTPFYAFTFHGRHNQHFIFKNNMIYARQNGHVVTYVGGDTPFVMMSPKASLKERQTFQIIPEKLKNYIERTIQNDELRNKDVKISLIEKIICDRKGSINSVLRFSIIWNDDGTFDPSDLDAHVVEPDNTEIYYSHKKNDATGGNLDIDITSPNKDEPAIENITWPNLNQMHDGTYRFFVHQCSTQKDSKGFKAVIKFENKTFYYDYNSLLDPGENVDVAKVTLKNGRFTIEHCLFNF